MVRSTILLVATVLLLTACGDSEVAPSAPPSTGALECVEGATEGCHMVVVSFDTPMTLQEAQALTAEWPGVLHGVWREDWVCLETSGFGFTEESPASRFAYLGAESIPDRVGELGPPPTDGGQSDILWRQRIEARERIDDAPLVAAAVWLPTSFSVPAELAGRVVPHRYTHGDAAVLYIGGPGYHVDPVLDVEFPWATPPPDCTG